MSIMRPRFPFAQLFAIPLLLFSFLPVPAAAARDRAPFDVRDHGAKGDGIAMDTEALNEAVRACAEAGGGVVHVPPGRYLTGTVRLLSHVTLEISGGAVIEGSDRPEDYPDTPHPWVADRAMIAPLIYAEDAENITITGRGTIDGRGAAWWHRHRLSQPEKYPPGPRTEEDRIEVGKLSRGRPRLVRLVNCRDVLIERVNLANSPMWTLHPMFCERLTIDGISIESPHDSSHNTDGINPESCRDVRISNCRIDTGDDGITIKSGRNRAGRAKGIPCENITISNCIVRHAHGGVTIGSEMSGGVRNVVVSNCIFHGTDNGIRLKTERGRGGTVEGLSVSNVVMRDVPNPFHLTMFYGKGEDRNAARPVDETTPVFRDMVFSNITARGAKRAGHVFGLPESPVENLSFSNVRIGSERGFEITHAKGVSFSNSTIRCDHGPALVSEHSSGIDSGGLETDAPAR